MCVFEKANAETSLTIKIVKISLHKKVKQQREKHPELKYSLNQASKHNRFIFDLLNSRILWFMVVKIALWWSDLSTDTLWAFHTL